MNPNPKRKNENTASQAVWALSSTAIRSPPDAAGAVLAVGDKLAGSVLVELGNDASDELGISIRVRFCREKVYGTYPID